MEASVEIAIGNKDPLLIMEVGLTARMGEWFVTRVPDGWIYTLRSTNAALGHAVAEHHSIYVPQRS